MWIKLSAISILTTCVTALQQIGCDQTSMSITYFSDPNCQHSDLETTQQEQLKMLTKAKENMLDGFCHDISNSGGDTKHLRTVTSGALQSSVRYSCTDESYSEVWYVGSDCAEAELFVDMTAAWDLCVTMGDVSFKASRE